MHEGADVDHHGAAAADYASRAIVSLEAEGDHERARFWFVMLVMLDDIRIGLVDPDAPIAIH